MTLGKGLLSIVAKLVRYSIQ